jgi:hypothetical protein
MSDDFREFVELPGLAPTKAEAETGSDNDDAPGEAESFDHLHDLPPVPVHSETPAERSIVDRKGREWVVTVVEDPAGGETVTLRYRHGAIEVLAQNADANWARFPSSKLLGFAGLD